MWPRGHAIPTRHAEWTTRPRREFKSVGQPSQSPVVAALVSSSFVVSGTPSFVVLSNRRLPACRLSFVWFCGLVRWSVLSRAVRGMLPRSDASITVRSFVTSGCVRSSRWLRRISAVASALARPVSATHSCQLEVPFCRSVLSSLFSRAWSVALLLDYSVCSFVRFPSVLLVWSVVSSVCLSVYLLLLLVCLFALFVFLFVGKTGRPCPDDGVD